MRLISLKDDRDGAPRCSAKLSFITREFWQGRGRPANQEGSDICQCYAVYKIGRKYFCKKHAGLYLLNNFTRFEK